MKNLRSSRHHINKTLPLITTITCTNKPHLIENILDNFERQNYQNRELILVLNNNSIQLAGVLDKTEKLENIKVYNIDENITLGKCKNKAIIDSKGDFIAFFDDDDYYSECYLTNAINELINRDADIVGKVCCFFYFKKNKKLTLKYKGQENQFIHWVNGSGMVVKRAVFNNVLFRDINLGDDKFFIEDCWKFKTKIYATGHDDCVVIRDNDEFHTWQIEDEWYSTQLEEIAEVTDFLPYLKC